MKKLETLPRWLPITLILLLAFALRVAWLTELPPGLTHDEANHGREAIGILDGILLFYFPLNYGSEPLYSYTAALSMLLFGENLFALRFVNVVFGTAAIGAAAAWTGRVFNRRAALLAALLLTLSFWPLASSREALRAGMLPLFMIGAAWFFWRFFARTEEHEARFPWTDVIGFGVCVAVTLHIYLAARVVWLLFPVFVGYLRIVHRARFRKTWLPTLAGLLFAGLLVTPMFIYLARFPYALTRLDMLDGPLLALRQGDLRPILGNARSAFTAFFWPGAGDTFLAYNIPGRPVFDAVTALFFLTGLGVALWRVRQPRYAFLLLWFLIGIAPSLITGATANTTRNLAAWAPAFMLPAVGFSAIWEGVRLRRPSLAPWLPAFVAIWLLFTSSTTINDYFFRWGQMPDVRGAYQVNLVAALDYVEKNQPEQPVLLSTVYPGPAHDPSIALVLSGDDAARHWVDARQALLFPGGGGALALIPDSTPPHAAFTPFLGEVERVELRVDDLDPAFTVYQLDAAPLAAWPRLAAPVDFNDGLLLRSAVWLQPEVAAGETAVLATLWEVRDATAVGPVVPPAFTTDAVLFTQLLDETGVPFAQRDSLEAPSWDWADGDLFLQLHPIPIPPETAAGEYAAIVGAYDRQSGVRLPVLGGGDYAPAPPLRVRTSP